MITKNITQNGTPFSGCGFIGALALNGRRKSSILDKINFQAMLDSIRHRGPEAEGTWKNDTDTVRLGHRRLSILDLSERGNQPMTRDQLTIVSNGEVYNFQDIKHQLEQDGVQFSSETDTEVILRAYQKWGADALHKFNGMFALAIWDDKKKTLFLARDRIGIKPLYYYRDDKILLFGSEIQALMHSGCVPVEINWKNAYPHILVNSFYHHDHLSTLVKNVNPLPPGHFMIIKPDGQTTIKKYWDIPNDKIPDDPSQEELSRQLQELMEDSIRLRLVSDVPVAAFLSGGMDSSVINALASRLLKEYKLTAITICYEGGGEDVYSGTVDQDLHYSRIIAQLLKEKINHKVIHVKPTEISIAAIDGIMDLSSLSDDDRFLSVYGNYQTVNRQGFKVVLNGQGADEIMGGYVSVKFIVQAMLDVQQPDKIVIRDSFPFMSAPAQNTLNNDVLAHTDEIYENMHQHMHSYPGDLLEKVHRYLMNTELQRILRFEDYFSMQSSVECRVPFLDHRLIEWAFRIPFWRHIRVQDRMGKMLLRQAAVDYLPKELIERPKQAFPAPDQQRIHDTLYKLFRQHRSQIAQSEFIQRVYKKSFLNQENPTMTSRELWLMICIWRWENRLKSFT